MLYRLHIITLAGVQYHSHDTFTRERAEWHLRNLSPVAFAAVWISEA